MLVFRLSLEEKDKKVVSIKTQTCYRIARKHKDIELLDAIDDNSNSVVLVSVDSAKYLLNYWPDTVLNIRVMDFDIKKTYDINTLHKKTGLS
jgi:hypothetical protein